jgi:hypothetical protein
MQIHGQSVHGVYTKFKKEFKRECDVTLAERTERLISEKRK